jgi:hypothetical protein
VVGACDRHGAYPQTIPVGPWDIAATMFAAIGIDPPGHYEDLAARPFPVTRGKSMREIYMRSAEEMPETPTSSPMPLLDLDVGPAGAVAGVLRPR